MQNKNKKAKRNFRKRLTGVRFKFVGLTTALVVVLLALLNSYPVQSSRDMVFSEKQTAMTNQAGTAASSLASLDHLSRESIAEVLNLLELDNYERVLVTNEKGRVLYDSAAEENQTGQQPEIKAIARAMEGKTSFYSRFTSEAFFSHVAVPILRDAKVIGAVYLDEKDEEQAGIITGIQSRIRTISAFICILALLADILMTSLLTKRIVTLAEMTKKVAEGDYSQRFLTQGEDEVAELGREFNRLTQRLETTEKQRRQFVSDASHELKTPIAAITLLADSIVQNENMDEETIREFVTDIVHESNRLQKMTEELLDLSRMDDGNIGKSVPVNMTKVTEEAVALLKPLSSEQNVEIKLDLEPDSIVLATENDLYHVVFNLVENAIKYNVPEGKVTVTLRTAGDRIRMEVEDTGIGIPENERESIFHRFYRVDKARSREAGGSGLGLSIAHDAVLQHRGTIEVEEVEPQGTRFIVTLPKGPPCTATKETIVEGFFNG
ncbi:MAG: HAMP domain-containing protein [Oscillospiraceae bacterium]|nr:HAMP domain-containing protein [Oscillospiraceae bacterium]